MNKLVFTSHVASNIEGTGGFKPDEDGYYTIRVGTFGVRNSQGVLYKLTDELINTLENSSPFMERVKNGKLYSENGHPQQQIGESKDMYFKRLLRIAPERVCGFIKNVIVDFNDDKTEAVIWLVIKPYGELKDVLEDSFSNPDINTSFSVRTISRQSGYTREVVVLITWDHVTFPGIDKSDKMNSAKHLVPATEENFFEIDLDNNEEVAKYKTIIDETKHEIEDAKIAGLESGFDTEAVKMIDNVLSGCDGDNCIYRW